MTQTATGNKRRWPWFGLGMISGALGTAIFFGVIWFATSFRLPGAPQAWSDEELRMRIEHLGFELPPSAHNLYYSYAGFPDIDEFASFSASPEDCASVLRILSTGQNASSTTGGSLLSEHTFINAGPGQWGSEWETPLWDIHDVKQGIRFESDYFYLLVDTDHNRVFICRWMK